MAEPNDTLIERITDIIAEVFAETAMKGEGVIPRRLAKRIAPLFQCEIRVNDKHLNILVGVIKDAIDHKVAMPRHDFTPDEWDKWTYRKMKILNNLWDSIAGGIVIPYNVLADMREKAREAAEQKETDALPKRESGAEKLQRNAENCKEEEISRIAEIIDRFWQLHAIEPATGFTPEQLAKEIVL